MPKLKKRTDGRYRCKYHGVYFYGSSDDEAKAKREEYKRQEKIGFATGITVIGYSLPWLKRAFPAVADTTYTGLAIHLQHLVDTIGGKPISNIVPSDLKQVYATHYNGLSNTYIRAAKQLYCSLFDAAMADGLIGFNPARERSAKPHRGKAPKSRVLTPSQREWINTLCTDHRAYPAVMAMLYAGVRPQEMKAIDIDRDVDFENETITIRETAHIDGQKYAFSGDMKTDYSYRQVPLFPPLKSALEGRHGPLVTKANGEPLTLQAWKCVWDSYLFNMETAINGVQKRWYGIKKGTGDKPWIEFKIVPYTLRHAFCCMCRDYGVELNTCRRWMGHADAKMIIKVYDSVSDERITAERVKVELALTKNPV